jgi:hypothetical protein
VHVHRNTNALDTRAAIVMVQHAGMMQFRTATMSII